VRTDFRGEVRRLALQAFASANHALKRSPLREAILAKSHVEAEAAVSPAVEAMEKAFTKKYPALLTRMIASAGAVAGKNLVDQLLRARITANAKPAIKLDYKLDVTNPKSVEWIKERALTLVKGVTTTTREALREEILSAFEEQRSIDDIISDIISIIDDPNRAEVIARTETMDAANEGQQLLWDQAVDDGLLTGERASSLDCNA
jgi:hypothetical protein